MDMAPSEIKTEGIKGPKIKPISLGLISDPATLVLIYDIDVIDEDSQKNKTKRRKRKMPLRNFTDRSKVMEYSFGLTQRHAQYLADILPVTLQKMLRVIQEVLKGVEIEGAVRKVNKEYEISGEEDLNKLTTSELDRKKAIMDEDFRKHLVRPGDPGYVYDKVVTFEEDKREPSAWDEDTDNDDQEQDVVDPLQVTVIEAPVKSVDCVDSRLEPPSPGNFTGFDVELKAQESSSDALLDKIEHMKPIALLEVQKQELFPAFQEIKTTKEDVKLLPQLKEVELKRSYSDSEGLDQILEIETGNVESDEDFWA